MELLAKKDLVALSKQVLRAPRTAPITYSFDGESKQYNFEDLQETLRDQFKMLAGNYNLYRRNINVIFELMQEVIDDVLPIKIMERYGAFAEIKQYGQGNKPYFTKKTGRQRAKQFITKVGLAGIYEVFQLDKTTFDIETTAYGGAALIGFEEFLDGAVDFVELINIILEGLNEAVFVEIAKAIAGVYNTLQSNNKAQAAGFDPDFFDPLLTISRAYGTPVIFAGLELASKIVPPSGWVSDNMRDAINAYGYLGMYKSARVILLPQSYTDETNSTQVFDPSFCFIMPSGDMAQPIKIALEGETIIDEYVLKSRARELQAYRKFGVGMVVGNDFCMYRDTDLIP